MFCEMRCPQFQRCLNSLFHQVLARPIHQQHYLQHFIIYQDIRVAKTIVYSSPELESLFYDFSVGLGALVAYLVFQ